jgi:hypothetical protein
MQRGFDGAFAQNGRCQKTIALGPLGFIGAGVIGRDWLGYGSTVALDGGFGFGVDHNMVAGGGRHNRVRRKSSGAKIATWERSQRPFSLFSDLFQRPRFAGVTFAAAPLSAAHFHLTVCQMSSRCVLPIVFQERNLIRCPFETNKKALTDRSAGDRGNMGLR